jgi:prepilin-type N-terminal cleavage/methylation domain-containing protein/prepilin-type processing-associated H-X9-DG protein
MTNRREKSLRGFTLIEVLVAVSVIGIVIALLLSGVQAAREAGRRAACINNLRQLGIALAAYESTYRQFPPMVVFSPPHRGEEVAYSAYGRLLPELDQGVLFNALNFSSPVQPAIALDPSHPNFTVSVTRLQVLICPSDSIQSPAPASYRLNEGRSPFWYNPTTLYGNDPDAPFYHTGGRRPAQITDGLSNTAFLSERLVGDGTELTLNIQRDIIPATPSAADALHFDQPYWNVCQASESSPVAIVNHFSESGWQWLTHSTLLIGYTHVMTPNQPVPDCNGDVNPWSLGGAVTARSFHPNGVNILLGDGRVQFATNGINPAVWRALSTISAGDSLGSGF